jgi:hypothetical protein
MEHPPNNPWHRKLTETWSGQNNGPSHEPGDVAHGSALLSMHNGSHVPDEDNVAQQDAYNGKNALDEGDMTEQGTRNDENALGES